MMTRPPDSVPDAIGRMLGLTLGIVVALVTASCTLTSCRSDDPDQPAWHGPGPFPPPSWTNTPPNWTNVPQGGMAS